MNSDSIARKCLVILFVGIFYASVVLLSKAADNQQDIKTELDKRIKAWGDYIGNKFYLSDLTGNKYYRDIIDLGMPALPYLIENVEQGNWALSDAIGVITRKRFEEYERPADYRGGSQDYAKLIVQWWPKARKETPHQFSQRYSQWKDIKKQGKEKEAKEKLEEIRALGIASLPIIIEKVKQGDNELIPIISKLTDGQVDPNASTSQCITWWQQNKENWLIPFPNKRPVAKAGNDITVSSGDTAKLDGSGSTDEDKDTLSYQWKQIAGPTVNLSDAQTAQPGFISPKVDKETVLVFELVVNDGSPIKEVHPSCQSGQSEPDTVTITVKPQN